MSGSKERTRGEVRVKGVLPLLSPLCCTAPLPSSESPYQSIIPSPLPPPQAF